MSDQRLQVTRDRSVHGVAAGMRSIHRHRSTPAEVHDPHRADLRALDSHVARGRAGERMQLVREVRIRNGVRGLVPIQRIGDPGCGHDSIQICSTAVAKPAPAPLQPAASGGSLSGQRSSD